MFPVPSGVDSLSCLEGTVSFARGAVHHHPPQQSRHLQRSAGGVLRRDPGTPPAPGNALINNNTAIGLLADSGFCDLTQPKNPDGSCRYPDYGPDCTPCTRDDLDLGLAENLPTTTGFASSALFDVNNVAGSSVGRTIDRTDGEACTADAECTRASTGHSAAHLLGLGLPLQRRRRLQRGEATSASAPVAFICAGTAVAGPRRRTNFSCKLSTKPDRQADRRCLA